MTDVYTQENGSKRKFLAPVLVILLCMVSLTAAGYAYSATVDNTGDSTDIDGVTLEVLSGEIPVSAAMYTIDNINFATHIVNGKAIKYADPITGAIGFTSATTTAVPTAWNNLGTFMDGYYVEMLNGEAPVGYHADVDLDAAHFATNGVPANGVYKVGSTYTLKSENHTGAGVMIQADLAWDSAYTDIPAGLKEVYLVVKLGETVVGVVALSDAEFAPVLTDAIEDGATGTYSIEAYVALSDYQSTKAPSITTQDGTFGFSIHFKTVASA